MPVVEPELRPLTVCADCSRLRERLDLGLSMAAAALASLEDAKGTSGQRHVFSLRKAADFLHRFTEPPAPQTHPHP